MRGRKHATVCSDAIAEFPASAQAASSSALGERAEHGLFLSVPFCGHHIVILTMSSWEISVHGANRKELSIL